MSGGIYPNGLFWTVPLPRGAFHVQGNGRSARLRVDDVSLIETYQLFGTPSPLGTIETPAIAKLQVDWKATAPAVPRGAGAAGTPAEAFLGEFAPARATGTFSGLELGFGFSSNGQASSEDAYAEVGTERNGSFL
jgi:hypothetical protein